MTEEANGNQQAASTENGAKPPEIDYEAKYREAVAIPANGRNAPRTTRQPPTNCNSSRSPTVRSRKDRQAHQRA